MSFVVIGTIAVGLALDAFAVAVATSLKLRRVSPRQVFRFAFHFGLFQAFMPMIGWAAARYVADAIERWDHWVAFGLLTAIGTRAIFESLRSGEAEPARASDPTRGWSLVMFSVATSIDALAVGISFAVLEVQAWYPCAIIGLVTAFLTAMGMVFGSRLGSRLGRRVEVLGGVILIAIGAKILAEHTLGW